MAVEDMQASTQLTSAIEVDVTGLLRRMQERQQFAGTRRTGVPAGGDKRILLLPSLVSAIAVTLEDHPALNANIDVAAGTVTYRDQVDLGVVVSGPRGDIATLFIDAGGRSDEDIAAELATARLLAMAGARAPRPTADPMFMLFDRPGTPILFETPPLPQGTSAALALGWVERRPIATPEGG